MSGFNGKIANISIDIDDNGTNEHYTTQLTNEDLDNILNIPSVNNPIDQRLLNDFTPLVLNKCKIKNRKQTPMFIDFDQEPLLLPLRIRKKYTRRKPILRTYSSIKHKSSKKSRR